jgi:predicted ATPase/class 3 adenylate cyclase
LGQYTGTVTFLFTDIEGSTRLWEEYPDEMRISLAQHDDLLRACIECHDGRVVKTVGDAFCSVFSDPRRAIEAVVAAQSWLPALALRTAEGERPLKVRMALHSSIAEERDGDYFGQPLNRVARLLAIGHGGQVLLSASTRDIVQDILPEGASLRDMGERRLKDLIRPEHVYQLCHPDLLSQFPPLHSLDARPNNLPIQTTTFIGREREMAQIKKLMKSSRLLTLTGSGGCGKTRLSLYVVADLIDDFADGVWFVELAPVADPNLVAHIVAQTVDVQEEMSDSILETLAKNLREKQLLLVLDNCEHLVDSCAVLCQKLLTKCADVRILTSSREALRIPGETLYHVPSLSTPDPHQKVSIGRLSEYETVRLFKDRACLVQPEFVVTDENASALVSICHRLDGIPLAIELAAARVRSMSIQELERRLDQRFRLLTGGSRTVLPRQQTLRSLIDWSYDLLNDAEKALFCRLSVFVGGWTIESAERICSGEPVDEWDVLDLLTSLSDKSMILVENDRSTARYRMLETVRHYGLEALEKSEGSNQIRDRHLNYFVAQAEEALSQLSGANQQEWLQRLETDHDNIRAALEWSQSSPERVESGLRIAGAIWRFWLVRGHWTEGRERLKNLLEISSHASPAARASALHVLGMLSYRQGDHQTARPLLEECLALQRELGDRTGVANLLNNLGVVASFQGRYEDAKALCEESLALMRELEDSRGVANALSNLGNVASMQNDYQTAGMLYQQGLAVMRELGDQRGIANSLNNLGFAAFESGNLEEAWQQYQEALNIQENLGDKIGISLSLYNLAEVSVALREPDRAYTLLRRGLALQREINDRQGIAMSLRVLGELAAGRSEYEEAAIHWGAAERLSEELGVPVPANEKPRFEQNVANTRAQSGNDAAFDTAWHYGRSLTLEQALERVLNG